MSEEVAKEIIAWMQGTREFVQDQAPELASEIIQYSIVANSCGVLIGLAFLACAIPAFRYGAKHKDDVDMRDVLGIGGACILTVSGGVIVLVNFFHLLRVLLAPRVHVLKVFGSML